jgi:hypothetical protein
MSDNAREIFWIRSFPAHAECRTSLSLSGNHNPFTRFPTISVK